MTILIVSASFCTIIPAYSAPGTEISVINPITSNNNFEFYNYSTPVGSRFNATVKVYEVEDLFSYQVLMNINETLLNITNAWLPTWDTNWVFYGETSVRPAPFFYDNNGNNISESMKIADSLLGESTFNGDGLLAIIEFEIIFTPAPTEESVSCGLDINNADTFLLDSSASNEIPATKTNGHYYYLNLPPGESIISIIVNPSAHVVFGENVSITGSVIPTKNNVTVTIQYKLNVTGSVWQNLTKVQTDSSSQYSHIWETNEAGEFNLKSLWEGDNVTSGAESRMVLLDIKYISTISINVSPTNVTAASTVVMNGTIMPTPLEQAIVTIQIRLNGTEIWKNLDNTMAANGIYSYIWIATKKNETIVDNSTIRGMENNTFEFRAKWLGDNTTFGSQSQPQYPTVIVHKTTSSVTINVSPQTVERGMNVTISGTVEPAIPGLPITMEYSTQPVTAPGAVAAIKTVESKIDGSYSAIWNVGQINRTDYFLYAFIRKNADVFETTNYETFEPALLTVTGVSSNITISVNPSEANIGAEVTINGRIEPARENVKVTIQLGNTQKFAYSDAEGHYSFSWKAGNFSTKNPTTGELVVNWIAGVYHVYAKWAGDDIYKGATSPTVTLTVVRNSTSLTMDIDPETITLGANVSLTGTLTPAKASIDVTIYYRNATSQWILLATVKTNPTGNFSFTWTPDVAGEFELYANWTGDAIDAAAESQIVTLKVESPFTIFTYLPYIAVGITVVVAVALAYLYLQKKKKPSK